MTENYDRPVVLKAWRSYSYHLLLPFQRVKYLTRTPLQLTLEPRKANSTPGSVNRSMVQERDYPPLFSTCETTSRHWIQFWAPLVLERHPSSGMVSVRSTWPVRSSWGAGTCSAWRRNSFGEDIPEHPTCTPLWGGLRGDRARGSLWCMVGGWQT